MKIIFMGTPEYAVPALKELINSRHEVVAVVSQPDKVNARNNTVRTGIKDICGFFMA